MLSSPLLAVPKVRSIFLYFLRCIVQNLPIGFQSPQVWRHAYSFFPPIERFVCEEVQFVGAIQPRDVFVPCDFAWNFHCRHFSPRIYFLAHCFVHSATFDNPLNRL